MKAELRWLSGTPELFTIQSEGLIDEQDQPSDIPFGQPTHLAFPDHVHLESSAGLRGRTETPGWRLPAV
jgi:hypothetical protein